jgi:hypothetical protein
MGPDNAQEELIKLAGFDQVMWFLPTPMGSIKPVAVTKSGGCDQIRQSRANRLPMPIK